MSIRILQGDCLAVLPTLDAESIDAVVTDPPAGIAFMGKSWDRDKGGRAPWVAWMTEVMVEVVRVMKPGAHAVVWAMPRTAHWTMTALEDAGLTIRDCIGHVYGSGFPKGLRPVTSMWDNGLQWLLTENAPSAVQVSKSIRVRLDGTKESIVLALARILPGGEPALLMETGKAGDSSGLTVILLSESQAIRLAIGLNMTSSWKESSGVAYDEVNTSITETTSRMIIDPTISNYLTGLLTTGRIPTGCSTEILPNGLSLPVSVVVESSTGERTKPTGILTLTALGSATDNDIVKWAGWNVALKPSAEWWILCRKPFRSGVAANVLEHGTGALNIAASRVAHRDADDQASATPGGRVTVAGRGNVPNIDGRERYEIDRPDTSLGRWPPNLLLQHSPGCTRIGTRRVKVRSDTGDRGTSRRSVGGLLNQTDALRPTRGTGHADADGREEVESWRCSENCPVRLLDQQSGERASGTLRRNSETNRTAISTRSHNPRQPNVTDSLVNYGDTGTASRFFPVLAWEPDDFPPFLYTAKESTARRNQAWGELPERTAAERVNRKAGSAGMESPRAGAGRTSAGVNSHPTVKSLALMDWLCRLVCPPGGTVLDPFLGSGSTLCSAARIGFNGVGIEMDPEYVAVARARVAWWQGPLFAHENGAELA